MGGGASGPPPGFSKRWPVILGVVAMVAPLIGFASDSASLVRTTAGLVVYVGIVAAGLGVAAGATANRRQFMKWWKAQSKRQPDDETRRRARDLVWHLHRKSFGDGKGQHDQDYRVSLLLLVRGVDGKEWVCYGRSGDIPAEKARRWPHSTEPSDHATGGLVVHVTVDNYGYIEVPGVPEGERNDATLVDYRRRCFLTEQVWKDRTWKYASFGLYVARREGRVPFVLVIERESGKQLEPVSTVDLKAQVQYAGEFWCSPEGDAYDAPAVQD